MIRAFAICFGLLTTIAFCLPASAQETAPKTPEKAISQEVQPAPEWDYSVAADRLPRVDNLAIGPDRGLYVTLERGQKQGEVLKLTRDGVTSVVSGLQKADGLAIRGQHLFVTEETIGGRLLMVGLESGKTVTLGNFQNPEGIAIRPDGAVLLTEDIRDGRLLAVSMNGKITTLVKHLRRPEGIELAPDGTIYIAETATGRILAFQNGVISEVATGLAQPDQIMLGPGGGLWVTEDQARGRLLRIGPSGIEVIASNLRYPQGMVYLGGGVLLAEQGRGRILSFFPKASAP